MKICKSKIAPAFLLGATLAVGSSALQATPALGTDFVHTGNEGGKGPGGIIFRSAAQ